MINHAFVHAGQLYEFIGTYESVCAQILAAGLPSSRFPDKIEA